MKRRILSLFFLFLINLGVVFGHGIEEGFKLSDLISFERGIVVILAIVVVVLGFKVLKNLDEGRKETITYFITGVVTIGLIYFSKLIIEDMHLVHIPEGALAHIDGILAIIALTLFLIGFYKLKKN